MSVVRLTKEFTFEMSHALEGYDGLCSQIHGHSYRLFVTVRGVASCDPEDPKLGMVMDFGALKQIINKLIISEFDHSMLIRATEDNAAVIEMMRRRFPRVIALAWQPTCENLITYFASIIAPALPPRVTLHSLRLHETATSFAEWFASDNP